MPLRIAIKATNLGSDGISSYVRSLLAGLQALGSDHEFSVLTDSPELLEGRWAAGFRPVALPAHARRWEHLGLPDWLADNRIDVYHGPAFSLPAVRVARYVSTFHDCIPLLFPGLVGGDFTRYFAHWAPVWTRLADHLICDSRHTAHDLQHLLGVAPGRSTVVPLCAEPPAPPLAPHAWAALQQRLRLDAPYLLMVGRVELRKNVVGMLRAFELLRRRALPRHLLVLAGSRNPEGHDPEGLLPQLGRRGEVVVTGELSAAQLAALYRRAAACCYPTFYEGFGLPVLEAMQHGVPLVTTRVSSVPEVGGDACLYVSPYDAGELADALQRVLTEAPLRAELVRRGFARAGQFTAERMAAETLAVYERVGSGEACRHRRRRLRSAEG